MPRTRVPPLLVCVGIAVVLCALTVGLVYLIWPPRVIVAWETASEVEVAGFAVQRAEAHAGPFEPLPGPVLPARGDPLTGAAYRVEDRDVAWGRTYYYRLEEVARDGERMVYPRVVSARAGPGWGAALGGGALAGALGGAAAARVLNRRRRGDDCIDSHRG